MRSEFVAQAVANPEASPPPPPAETLRGEGQTLEFQAETKKLLDIVAKSLYTDKEVFVRELVSNGSDAMEKARQLQNSGKDIVQPELPFQLSIYADRGAQTLTIQVILYIYSSGEYKIHRNNIN